MPHDLTRRLDRIEARLDAAIERELARFTPERQAELLDQFLAEWDAEARLRRNDTRQADG